MQPNLSKLSSPLSSISIKQHKKQGKPFLRRFDCFLPPLILQDGGQNMHRRWIWHSGTAPDGVSGSAGNLIWKVLPLGKYLMV